MAFVRPESFFSCKHDVLFVEARTDTHNAASDQILHCLRIAYASSEPTFSHTMVLSYHIHIYRHMKVAVPFRAHNLSKHK